MYHVACIMVSRVSWCDLRAAWSRNTTPRAKSIWMVTRWSQDTHSSSKPVSFHQLSFHFKYIYLSIQFIIIYLTWYNVWVVLWNIHLSRFWRIFSFGTWHYYKWSARDLIYFANLLYIQLEISTRHSTQTCNTLSGVSVILYFTFIAQWQRH